jgi:MFS family permease
VKEGVMFEVTYFISNHLFSLSVATGISSGVLGLVFGLLLLVLGYKLKKVALALIGILVGISGGAYLADRFLTVGTTLYIIVPAACAVIGALLAFVVYKIALYVMGFAVGGAVGVYLAIRFIQNPIWGIVIAVVLAIIVGSVALAAEKPIMILATAFIGYILFRLGLYLLIKQEESLVIEIGSLGLLVVGIAVQFLTNRKEKEQEEIKTKKKKSEKIEGFDDSFQFDDEE